MPSQSPRSDHEQNVGQQLQYRDQAALLDAIDKMKTRGLTKYISLPTIVVCGDQSSGKSSVLEAISHVRFPVNDTLCTTFATELIIRRQQEPGPPVNILPDIARPEAEKQRLKEFAADYNGPDDLPNLIQAAQTAMSSSTGQKQRIFFNDILQVRVCKPDWPPLTIVDLPGLIHAQNPGGSVSDIAYVRVQVERYMAQDRTIILAIVSAQSDTATQQILSLAKIFDPQGTRTLGVITKPDTLPAVGSQSLNNYLRLARNEVWTYHFQQGWHVLKNRSYDKRLQSAAERDAEEREFFSQEPWNSISSGSLGVDALRKRLSRLLHVQIVSKLDEVKDDITTSIYETEIQLEKLGSARETEEKKRKYLTVIAERSRSLIEAGISGTYIDKFFDQPHTTENQLNRLRACLQDMNEDFSDIMHSHGHRWQIVQGYLFTSQTTPQLRQNLRWKEFNYPDTIQYPKMIEIVDEIAKRSRGQEPRGFANPLVVGEIFRKQSEKWTSIATHHIKEVWTTVKSFLDGVFQESATSETYSIIICEYVEPAMQEKLEKALAKLIDIARPFTKHNPTSLNKRLLSIVDEKRLKRAEAQKSGDTSFQPSNETVSSDSSQPWTNSAMDRFGSGSILDYMQAYYEVAISTFIDNVVSLIVEACFVDDLPSIFAPTAVATFSQEQLTALASESEELQSKRHQFREKLACLKSGLQVCNSHSRFVSRDAQRSRFAGSSSTSGTRAESEDSLSARLVALNLASTARGSASASKTTAKGGLFDTPFSSGFAPTSSTNNTGKTSSRPLSSSFSPAFKPNAAGSIFSTPSSSNPAPASNTNGSSVFGAASSSSPTSTVSSNGNRPIKAAKLPEGSRSNGTD